MLLNNLCGPALIYLIFSLTQIIIDLFKNLFNTALLKFIVMIIFTTLLDILCKRGLGVISWMIVFVPFIFMTLITSILLFTFGLDPGSGKLQDYEVKNYEPERNPYSYNMGDGELLNNYYEEIDIDSKDNKHNHHNHNNKHHKHHNKHHKHHNKNHKDHNKHHKHDKKHHKHHNDYDSSSDEEDYDEIRSEIDKKSKKYYKNHSDNYEDLSYYNDYMNDIVN